MTREPGPDLPGPSVREAVPDRFLIGEWVVEAPAGRLCRGETSVHVEPKVMEVLLALAAEPGDVVPRDRLFERVWPDVVVTDSAINRSVSDLRRVLGDDPRRPTYIETIPKVGYRLLLPVEPLPSVAGDGLGRAGAPPLPPALPYAGAPSGDGLVGGDPPAARSSRVTPRSRAARRGGAFAALIAVVVAAGVTVWGGRGDPFADALAGADARVLTTLPGPERFGALSPDGSALAFVSFSPDGEGPSTLYVQGLSASAPRAVARGARHPAWSPDGRSIAFVRSPPPGAEGETAVYTVSEYGTDERRVVAGDLTPTGLAWTPDGAAFVAVGRAAPDGPQGVVVIDLATGARRQLTDGDGGPARDVLPVVSPDGERVAFMRWVDDSASHVYVVPFAGGDPVRVTDRTSSVAGVAWTPDGRSVVFSSDRTGLFRLWVAEPGQAPRRLAVPAQDPGSPTTSPAGVLAYADWRYDTNVWVAPTAAPAEGRAVHASTLWEEEPALSPDGARVAFVSTRSGAPELWAGRVKGGEPVRLTDHGGALHAPRWSPDGRRIAYQARAEDGYEVYVVSAEGGRPRRLTTHPGDDVNPRWSRDGRSVLLGSERGGAWAVWRVPVEGGAAQRVLEGAFVAEAGPDGTLYSMRPGEAGLYAARPGSEPRRVADVARSDWHNWAVTSAGVFALDRSAGAPRVVRIDPGGSTVVAAGLGELTPFRATLSVADDGSALAWGRVDSAENDIVVVEGLGRP